MRQLKRYMTMLTRYIIIIIVLIAFHSCSYDNTEEFYDQHACDTTEVSYNTTITTIIDNNCVACHFAGSPTGVDLETYSDVKRAAENGSLLGSLKHEKGWEPMPRNGKLDDCSIRKIEKWIDDGIQNN